jgi:hypothetical protein
VSPLTPEDLQSGTVRAFATDLSSGAIQELTTRNRSVCHFFEPFECGGHEVRLRLDWKDLDSQGNPTLDADFYMLDTGEMDKSMKAHVAHHTPAQSEGERAYEWEYADESRRLRVTLIWSVSGICVAKTDVSFSAEVTRAGDGS